MRRMRLRWAWWALALLLTGCIAPDVVPPASATLTCVDPCSALVAGVEGYAWEPHVAADPRDAQHLVAAVTVFRDGPAGATLHDLVTAVSRDGGRTWSHAVLPHGPDVPPEHPLAAVATLADPVVAFLPDGTVLLAGLAINAVLTPASAIAQGFRVFVARSHDGGATFPETVVVAEDVGVAGQTPVGLIGANLHGPDGPWLVVGDDGTALVSWRWLAQAQPAEPQRSILAYATSTDGARTWSKSSVPTGDMNAVATAAIVQRDGTFLLAFAGWDGPNPFAHLTFHPWLARSTDRGATWSTQRLGDGAWTPQMAMTSDGLLVVYPVRDAAGQEIVTMRASKDRGLTFGPPVALSAPDAPGQTIPTLAGDGTRAYLTYFHAGPSGFALRARMLGNGPPTEPITLAANVTGPPGDLGEYFGLAPLPAGAFAVWTTNEGEGRLMGARLLQG